jgi:hypothetical protein
MDPLIREIGGSVLIGQEVNTARLGHLRQQARAIQNEIKALEQSAPLIRGGMPGERSGSHLSGAIRTTAERPKAWFSAAELADLRLPGLPAEIRSVQRRAVEEQWAERRSLDGELLSRPRKGAAPAWNSISGCCPLSPRPSWRGAASSRRARMTLQSNAIGSAVELVWRPA